MLSSTENVASIKQSFCCRGLNNNKSHYSKTIHKLLIIYSALQKNLTEKKVCTYMTCVICSGVICPLSYRRHRKLYSSLNLNLLSRTAYTWKVNIGGLSGALTGEGFL